MDEHHKSPELFCAEPDVAYVSPYVRETLEKDVREMVLTPWTMQNICYEVLKNYMTEKKT